MVIKVSALRYETIQTVPYLMMENYNKCRVAIFWSEYVSDIFPVGVIRLIWKYIEDQEMMFMRKRNMMGLVHLMKQQDIIRNPLNRRNGGRNHSIYNWDIVMLAGINQFVFMIILIMDIFYFILEFKI